MTMKLLAIYVVTIIAGAFIAWGIGTMTATYSERLSLPVFLACFFLNFWLSWLIAVRLTEPKKSAG
jgi:lipopolysaccharide export LptBFGC system permease protein LptF